MKTVEVEVGGSTALLINRFKEQSEVDVASHITKSSTKSGTNKYGTPREQATNAAYQDKEKMWVPSTWISGALKHVSADYKMKGTKRTIKSVIGGAVVPTEEKLFFKEKFTIKDFEVDSRPVVVNRARIMRHRPRLENWTLKFSLLVDDSLIDVDTLHELVIDAGNRAGLGDFRPPKGGPFGRFKVTSWKIIK